jgi:hypothetical protein
VATELVASRVVLSSIELVIIYVGQVRNYMVSIFLAHIMFMFYSFTCVFACLLEGVDVLN